MTGKEPPVYWVIRWTDEQTDADMATVLQAPTRDAAELAARAQGIPYVLIARACQSDVADARRAQLVQTAATTRAAAARFTAAAARYTVLGRPLGHAQVAAVLLAGVATAFLHLRPILPAMMS